MSDAVTGQRVNQKQAAALLGCSSPYLSKLKRQGRIAPGADGLYDMEELRASIKAGSDITQELAAQSRAQQRDAAPLSCDAAAPPVSDDVPLDADLAPTGDSHADFKAARAVRERELALLARIDRLKQEGSMCLVKDVEGEAYTMARLLRDTLLGAFATKLAPKLVDLGGDTFAAEHLLRESLREVLAEIVRQEGVARAAG